MMPYGPPLLLPEPELLPLLDPEMPLLEPEDPLLDPEMPLLDPEAPLLEPENPLLDPETPPLDPELLPSSPPSPGATVALPPHASAENISASAEKQPHKTSPEARMAQTYAGLSDMRP
jgi:hypothetical protein